jgi:hypothetical protein
MAPQAPGGLLPMRLRIIHTRLTRLPAKKRISIGAAGHISHPAASMSADGMRRQAI